MKKSTFRIEVTDTFGGEANYSWVRRFEVKAVSFRGAITALAKREGGGFRLAYNSGDVARYDLQGACICAFVEAIWE